ncbi:MAG: DUF4852 domain-containing protein [Alphaproteobacteria bacterium]
MRYLFLCFAFVFFAFSTVADAQEKEYSKPLFSNLSKLYWSLDKFRISDSEAVDNYMRINECDIFRDYYFNEFEWRGIREKTRAFLENNKSTFNKRFEFAQPLSLGEYDFNKGGFHVIEDQKINATKRFQLYADDYGAEYCKINEVLRDYPNMLVVELNRPLSVDFIPVEEDRARTLVADKIKQFKEAKTKFQNRALLYQFRDAIYVMNLRFISMAGRDERISQDGMAAQLRAVLEGIEVYTDSSRDELLYSLDFRRQQQSSPIVEEMRKRYEEQQKKKDAEREAGEAAAQ